MASPGVAVSNGDGTFTIFINALFCSEKQADALRHELRHLIDNHFYRDDEIALIELEANDRFLSELSEEIQPDLSVVGM